MSPQNIEVFDLQQAFNEFADAAVMAEATAFKTFPTGAYTLQITKAEGQVFNGDARKYAHFTADVLDNGQRKGTVFFNASWEPRRRDADGKLDGDTNRWSELTRELFPTLSVEDRAKVSVAEVAAQAVKYPVRASVTESFHIMQPDGKLKWITARTPEEAAQYRKSGAEARNFVQHILRG